MQLFKKTGVLPMRKRFTYFSRIIKYNKPQEPTYEGAQQCLTKFFRVIISFFK